MGPHVTHVTHVNYRPWSVAHVLLVTDSWKFPWSLQSKAGERVGIAIIGSKLVYGASGKAIVMACKLLVNVQWKPREVGPAM